MNFAQTWTKKKAIIAIVILVIVGILFAVMTTQGVQVQQDDSKIKVSGGIFYSASIPYSEIESVTMTESLDSGRRTNGASIAQYEFGNYSNAEYGAYKLFANKNIGKYIVIHDQNKKIVVFNCKDEETTLQVYESLLSHIN